MEDLDIPQLAEYLHITPDQVRKMVSRGNLPGRRVGGDWKFNEAEIHHWLEERIGLSDQGELDQVRAVGRGTAFYRGLHQSDNDLTAWA